MSEVHDADEGTRLAAAAAFAKADQTTMFGPSFFLGQLSRFVRDHCPPHQDHLPMVEIRLADGQILDLCHIVGVSPRWVLLAVRDSAVHQHDMAIEIVPFEMVRGVRICPRRADGGTVGFSQTHEATIMPAETLLQTAMMSRREG